MRHTRIVVSFRFVVLLAHAWVSLWLADSAVTICLPWVHISQTGASATAIMALAFLQAFLPNLKLKQDTLVTGVCDLRGVLQSMTGIREKTQNMSGSPYKFLIVPSINKQIVDGGTIRPDSSIQLLPAAHMGEVLCHIVEGYDSSGTCGDDSNVMVVPPTDDAAFCPTIRS